MYQTKSNTEKAFLQDKIKNFFESALADEGRKESERSEQTESGESRVKQQQANWTAGVNKILPQAPNAPKTKQP